MTDVDLDFGTPGGGRARDTGGFYHVSFRSGSRASGACARSAHDYIAREGAFDDPDRDAAVHAESGHMPSWAAENPQEDWDAADLYERANGRLYVAGDFALPRGLELDDQIDLARAFVGELTESEHLPYTFAIHAGADRDGQEHNPHVHLMISERQNDGIERSKREWFRRANRDHPERGGALKSRDFHGRAWVERARASLARSINARLKAHGRPERVDHRSYERQGLDRAPGQHFGPRSSHMVERGVSSERLEEAADDRDARAALADVDREITRLEQLREAIERDPETPALESPGRSEMSAYTWDDDDTRGR